MLYLQHMEVPRLGVESELQLLAYATATAIQDPRHVCNLHHSSWQHQIPDPLSKARIKPEFLMDTSQIRLYHATTETLAVTFLIHHATAGTFNLDFNLFFFTSTSLFIFNMLKCFYPCKALLNPLTQKREEINKLKL